MKNVIAALVLLAAPAIAGAQVCTTSPCAATPITTALTVKSAVSFATGSNLNFGIVAPGTTAGVNAQGVSATGGSAGSVVLIANQAVTVTAAFSSLTVAGTPSIPAIAITSTSCGTDTAAAPSTTTTTFFNCATGATSAAAGTGATNLHIFLGGTVATTATTAAGTYSGTATVTGTYTVY